MRFPSALRPLPSVTRVLTLVLLSGTLAGCLFSRRSAEPPSFPAVTEAAPATRPVTVVLRGTPDMNQGNAVVARVYTLRGDAGLTQASLSDLWADDAAALRGDLVDREELRLLPDEVRSVALDIGSDVRHIAVVANLRAPTEDGWVHIFPVDELWGEEPVVIIEADRLVVPTE